MRNSFANARFVVALLTIATFLTVSLILALPTPSARAQSSRSASFNDFAHADQTTADIRDASMELVRVVVESSADRAAAGTLGHVIADHGSFVIVARKRGSSDGVAGNLETQVIETTVNLPGARFDPIVDPPAGTVRPGGVSAGGEKGYYVVQFGGIVTDEWLDSLRDTGVQILQYVPHNAFLVYADGAAASRAASHSRVRWVGAYTADQKIPASISDGGTEFEMADKGRAFFDVAVWARADLATAKAGVGSVGDVRVVAQEVLANNYFNVVRVAMPVETVGAVAGLSDVLAINPYYTAQAEDERAAQIVAGNYINNTTLAGPGYDPLSQFGADGTGVTVGMIDDGVAIPGNGGFYITAANTVNGPLGNGSSGASGGHGHINASIIAGAAPFGNLDPLGYNYGLGIAPRSNIVNIPFLFGYGLGDASMVNDAVSTPGPNGSKTFITNNSWGAGGGGAGQPYTSRAAMYDGFVRDASSESSIDPLVIVFSAGNQGTSGMTDPKAAKNIITTANSENLRTELSSSANNIADLASGSSRGPAADGRVKPDIAAPGTVITGSRAGNCGSVSSCFEANHAWSSGTSHAAPQVAGAAALFTNLWKNNNGGNNPSVALVKAAILNSGQEMTGANVAATVPNGAEGWGRMDMRFMMSPNFAIKHINETVAFSSPGESATFSGGIADPTKPIRVALVWTDPPGVANANPALVNNLDLTVTLGSTTYRGNVFSGGNSTTGGSADALNNVEMVRLPAPNTNMRFTIKVTATALNGDGILGNADVTDQHFALVAYNFKDKRAQADFDGDGKTDVSVFRPAEGLWYLDRSTDGFTAQNFGLNGDVPVPGDYDNDGKTDLAVFRANADGADPDFYVLNSATGTFTYASWGNPGDIPRAGDLDGDGRTDFTVYRPSDNTWYVSKSSGGVQVDAFGAPGDIPMYMDLEGVGRSNYAVFRPANSTWYIAKPTGVPAESFHAVQFGLSTDVPVPGDFDGNGADEIGVYRGSTGVWYILGPDGNITATQFGLDGDVPIPGDYDGDGSADIAVYRDGIWHMARSTDGVVQYGFGVESDIPLPKTCIP